ncbi:hypothetical protein LZ554_005876 [Drepanopeziza brunnea f. sp. 'monogermtubi']|nr:hypothetical protein LZ554_005876 [Drepanopeziza brunnea f. sp. 'monogermtubi']
MDLTSIDFEWLADLQKSQCFTTSEVSSPAKSSDFGADGHTASVTDWHELLQLTVPDATCGIVFTRGQFPNTPDAILARAQRRDDSGHKGTFGARVQKAEGAADVELGERMAQGWINLRWPYTRYELRTRGGGADDGSSGTCEQISFVRDGVLVQVLRLRWGSESSLSDYGSLDGLERRTARLKVGGVVQFGCPCSNRGPADVDTFHLDAGWGLDCVSERYRKRLEMHLFIDGLPQDLSAPLHGVGHDEVGGTEVNTSSIHDIELRDGEPVIVVSTYALRNLEDRISGLGMATFANLQDHLGTCNSSPNMTDRLWTALCSINYEASEAIDTCVIGRCVEQILGVSSIPFEPRTKQTEVLLVPHPKTEEIALLRNIMTPQYVDVQSSFFQIRLLVKVHNFMNSRHLEPDLFERFQPLSNMRAAYLAKLRRVIQASVAWLINTDMKPRKLLLALRSDEMPADLETQPSRRLERCEQNRVRMHVDQSYNQACYATLAVWYVMKYCPQALAGDFTTAILGPKLRTAYDAVQKRASRDRDPTPKNDVLQWLHLSCLFLICSRQFGTDGDATSGFARAGLDDAEVIKTQQKFEKYVARLKTSPAEWYSIENEELDRVLLLMEELGLDAIPTPFTASLASSRAAQTRKRITQRKRTTRFSPGPKVWKGLRATSNGPWELLCTNHLGFLRVTDESNVKAARERLYQFLMADYSFMTSWDRADSNMVGRWWDVEPASVICAALVDLKMEGKLRSAISEAAADELGHSIHDMDESPTVQRINSDTLVEVSSSEESIRDILLQMKKLQEDSSREHLLQMRQLLVQEDISSFSVRAFDWVECKPSQLYHPDWWVQSLQDTPEMYQAKQTKDVPLRKDIRRYLASRERMDIVMDPGYTPESMKSKIPATDLQFLSVFDLHLTKNFTFKTRDLTIRSAAAVADRPPLLDSGRQSGVEAQRSSRIVAVKQATDSYNYDQLDAYQKSLFSRLNDSLVDAGAKHRILFAEKCSPALVGSFIYVWHPDALDAFDSYFGSVSRFTESREVTMWTTSITISHWSIRPVSLSAAHLQLFRENRNNGDFPPASISRLGLSAPHRKNIAPPPEPAAIVEERCSSLVLTGDPAGHLWICTVWSSLTDADAIAPPIHALPGVLQRFIHQQACGRCLVFLILLGHLCEKLAAEYEEILARLDVIVGLGEQVLLEGLEWGTSEAVDKLKRMLWGLEALRVFDDRLSASLSQIQKAQGAMERTIKQEAGQQHVALLQEYNNVVEEFEKRFGMLSDVQIRTQLKIRQVTGLRDGISTVTNVEDSQTALRDSKTTIKQGNNIRILTYITIAYLPLGFVTGLFSIEHATFMDQVGNNGFAVLTVVFILGTYALALSLESIIEQWARVRKSRARGRSEGMKRGEGAVGKDRESETLQTARFRAMGVLWGRRRKQECSGGSVESEEKIAKVA